MNSPVQKIKERLTIEEVVSSYIKLEGAGSNLKAKCPFHNEKTASFFISPARGTYYCFGCAASGDIFTFVEEFEGLDFKGALKLLAGRAGIPLEVYTPAMKEAESEKEKLFRAMEEATRYFENNLKDNKEILDYLKARGLNEKSIKDFRIGYAKLDWRLLYEYLKSKNFTDKETERAGLAKSPEDKGKGMYDRFRGRIMFPIADSSGRVVAFSGRIFTDDGKSAKYLNSPETPVFSKNAVLYGIDKAKEAIRKNNFSILVEGQMDLILSHQAGYRNTVATSGTALSDSTVSKENVVSNLGLVRRLSQNMVLAFDADKAGASATIRAGKIALSLGMDVKVVEIPEGVDPADLISKEGADKWKEAIKNSKHIIEFLLGKTIRSAGEDTRKAGREIKEKILPFVDALESRIEKAHFIKKISEQSGIPLVALEEDLKKIEHELFSEKEEIKQANEALKTIYRKDYILRKLLGVILWQKSLPEPSIDAEKFINKLAEIIKNSPEELLQKAKENEGDLIFEAEVFYGSDSNIERDMGEMLNNLEEEYLKEELVQKMKELSLAEKDKDSPKSAQILKECQALNSRIQDIKNGRLKK
ncbi:MAG: DNA primase [Minisyncoccia bacterium]